MWPEIEPLLARAQQTSQGESELVDVFDCIQKQTMFLAVLGKAERLVLACVVQVVHYQRYWVLEIVYIGGRHLRVFLDHYLSVLVDFARELNCRYLQCATSKPALRRLFLRYRRQARVAYEVLREEI